jgi:RimJ/RimL family protein N-acetyltransferase
MGMTTPAPHPGPTTTPRLRLTPMMVADAEELFEIFSDPAGWWYDPGGRHATLSETRFYCDRAWDRWESDGLSYWTARDRQTGAVVGCGGVQRHRTGTWNLAYRIAGERRREGLALELARAGLEAARDIDPAVPVIAWVDELNEPSRRLARRLGLIDRGLRIDANDGRPRIAYSDRPLPRSW